MATTSELERLIVRLTGDGSSYLRMLNSAVTSTQNAARKMQAAGHKMQAIGGMMTIGITAPVLGMIKSYASFDDAMTKSTAIMSGVTADLRKEMEKTALQVSRNSTTSAADLAASYYFLASAGLDAKKSMMSLATVEQFATAGAFDMSTATDLLTDAQSALGMTAKDATENLRQMTKVGDLLVKANTLANASVQQFSEALTNEAGAAIAQYNMDVEEGIAILAAYADQGLKGNVAGSMMSRLTRLLIQAINDNGGAFKKLNIQVDEFAKTGKNVTGVIDGITKAVAGMGPAQKAATLESLGFQARVQAAVLPLLGATEKIRGYDAALRDAGGTTESVANKQIKSFTSQMKILWNRIKEISIIIGKELAPYVEMLSNVVAKGIEYWHSLSDAVHHTIAMALGLIAALGPVLVIVGTLTAGIGSMLATLAFLYTFGGAIISVIIGIAASFGWWIGVIGMAVMAIKMLVDSLYGDGTFVGALNSGLQAMANWAVSIVGFFANIGENWGLLTEFLKDNWFNVLMDIGNIIKTTLQNSVSNAGTIFNTLVRLVSYTAGAIKGKFEELFAVDFPMLIVTGLEKAAELFNGFVERVKGLWESIKNFDFDTAGGAGDGILNWLTDVGEQMTRDFDKGKTGQSFAGGAADIIKEQLGKMKAPLDGFESQISEMPDFVTDVFKQVDENTDGFLGDKKEQEKAALDAAEKTGTDSNVNTNEFKSMSLRQFSVAAIGGPAKAPKKQEVTDDVVAGKLDELIGVSRGKQVAVMAK